MRKKKKKLLAALLIINFIGISIAVTIASWLRPLYGAISFPAIILILAGLYYIYEKKSKKH